MSEKMKGIIIGAMIGLVVGIGSFWIYNNASKGTTAAASCSADCQDFIKGCLESYNGMSKGDNGIGYLVNCINVAAKK